MCKDVEKTSCIVLIETQSHAWQGAGEWCFTGAKNEEGKILEAIQFGILAAVRKLVRPGEPCFMTVVMSNLRLRPLFQTILADPDAACVIEDHEESFSWVKMPNQVTERGD